MLLIKNYYHETEFSSCKENTFTNPLISKINYSQFSFEIQNLNLKKRYLYNSSFVNTYTSEEFIISSQKKIAQFNP